MAPFVTVLRDSHGMVPYAVMPRNDLYFIQKAFENCAVNLHD